MLQCPVYLCRRWIGKFACCVQSPVWEGKTAQEKNKDGQENVTAPEVESPEVGKESASAAVMANGNSKVTEKNAFPVKAAAAIPEKKPAANGC